MVTLVIPAVITEQANPTPGITVTVERMRATISGTLLVDRTIPLGLRAPLVLLHRAAPLAVHPEVEVVALTQAPEDSKLHV